MKHKLITLQTFDEGDFNQLIAEIADARFLLEWAGPKYSFPLDTAQLNDTLSKARGEKPSYKVFKALYLETFETVGHIQLMNIDYNTATCILGRVLIFSDFRGKGFGKAMVKLAVKDAFENLGLHEIRLNVFDSNETAIAIYRSIGFVDYEFKEDARHFQNESWNLIKMKLNKDRLWLNRIY
jgi:RimJ/RimL family protein N-acetyltransferase